MGLKVNNSPHIAVPSAILVAQIRDNNGSVFESSFWGERSGFMFGTQSAVNLAG